MRVLLPHGVAGSEFGAGYTGDCVVDAMLRSLHARWPWRWPQTWTELGQLVRVAISQWGAGPQGQWDDVSMAAYLASVGYTTRQDDGAVAGGRSAWVPALIRFAGQVPCVLGITNAQALPFNESGVHNHGIALFGYDDAGYFLCSNGDATQGDPTQIQQYTADDLDNASLSSITWIEGPMLMPGDPLAMRFYRDQGNGVWARADNAAVDIRGGMLAYYCSVFSPGDGAGIDVLGLPLGNEVAAGPAYQLNGTFIQPTTQDFELGRLMYDPGHRIDARPGYGGAVFPCHVLPAPVPLVKPVAPLVAALQQVQQGLSAAMGWAS